MPSNIVTMRPDESNDKEFDKYPNIVPPGKTVAEIVKVEQVFDTQTVPIRRIEAMELGQPIAATRRSDYALPTSHPSRKSRPVRPRHRSPEPGGPGGPGGAGPTSGWSPGDGIR